MNRTGLVLAAAVAAASLAANAPPSPPPMRADLKAAIGAVDPELIRADLKFLADDLLEGRGTGQRGGEMAALYLETRFRQLGLLRRGRYHCLTAPIGRRCPRERQRADSGVPEPL